MIDVTSVVRYAKAEHIACLCDEPLAPYTTFKIGGRAAVLVKPASEGQIAGLLRVCHTEELPYYLIGNGSNLLISDDGIDGVVILLGHDFSQISLLNGHTLCCQAGASLSSVCRFALLHGLTGLEFAWGIPGSIGGAAYMNAGAYGGEMKDVMTSCTHLDERGEAGSLSGDALELSYRHSAYSDRKDCITTVTLSLKEGEPAAIRARMDELMAKRKAKQPLEFPSAGSTFRRPEGNYAAALIEQCGLKGVSVGDAMVSEKHSGFLVNTGHATCTDMLALIRFVQKTVAEQTGYHLECEVRILP